MRHLSLLLAMVVGCTDPEGPSTTDTSSTPIGETYEDVSSMLADIPETSGAPAITAGVVDGSGLRSLGSAGMRRIGGTDAVTNDDRWHLGSCTKAMTAALVGTFVDDGDLSFDSTLTELFPDVTADPAWKTITMRQLLTHTAGVGDFSTATWNAWWAYTGDDLASLRRALVEEVLAAPPEASVGVHVYSNAGFVIAGAALERITGDAWEDIMEERLFQPLGMDQCGFGPPPSETEPWAHDASGVAYPDFDNPPALGPAGTVHCSMASWARFVSANVSGPSGDGPLLTPETWQEIQSGPVDGPALGWFVFERPWAGGQGVVHAGSNTAWFAIAWVAPNIDRAYFAVTNSGQPDHQLTAVDEAIGRLLAHDPGE